MDFETIIGLEVHTQLLTKSKMFCRCSSDYASARPNTHVCPVCLGMPGVLPTINQQAIEHTVMTALALHCTVSTRSKFDRKNYPYPDLMKGYQISQYDAPIGCNGWLPLDIDDGEKRVGITRVHLEEDVAKLAHFHSPDEEAYSLVDINRSGVPLMEIVGEPDLRSPEEARQYLIKLRSILQYLGVSAANMEAGSFRCDANISIRPENTRELLPKVEVKNMNSFKAVYRALEYEAQRQRKLFIDGERLAQETRGWVEERSETVSQRSKEYAHDYRYFPEPDLPPLVISKEQVSSIESKLPELPEARRERFMKEYGLPAYDAELLTSSKDMADYAEELVKIGEPQNLSLVERAKLGSNWILGEVCRITNAHSITIEEFQKKVSPSRLSGLLILYSQSAINAPTAKSVLEDMFLSGRDAESIIRERGLSQISDDKEIEKIITQVISDNSQAVADYEAGKETAIKYLVGQVMKATRGRANPKLTGQILAVKLNKNSHTGQEA